MGTVEDALYAACEQQYRACGHTYGERVDRSAVADALGRPLQAVDHAFRSLCRTGVLTRRFHAPLPDAARAALFVTERLGQVWREQRFRTNDPVRRVRDAVLGCLPTVAALDPGYGLGQLLLTVGGARVASPSLAAAAAALVAELEAGGRAGTALGVAARLDLDRVSLEQAAVLLRAVSATPG